MFLWQICDADKNRHPLSAASNYDVIRDFSIWNLSTRNKKPSKSYQPIGRWNYLDVLYIHGNHKDCICLVRRRKKQINWTWLVFFFILMLQKKMGQKSQNNIHGPLWRRCELLMRNNVQRLCKDNNSIKWKMEKLDQKWWFRWLLLIPLRGWFSPCKTPFRMFLFCVICTKVPMSPWHSCYMVIRHRQKGIDFSFCAFFFSSSKNCWISVMATTKNLSNSFARSYKRYE